MRKSVLAAVLFGASAVVITPAIAHHSFAMFDPAKVITLKGTVKEFRWVNPHVSMFVNAQGDNGGVWAVELTSPGNLTRLGWSRKTMKPGDIIEVQVNPLRDGRKGGGFRQVKLPDGKVMKAGLFDLERKPG